MPFTLIKGTFHVLNYSPDGDSIRFAPADLDLMRSLPGGTVKINARGHVQLRIEAIDTLETHYSPPSGGGALHQPLQEALAAAEALMDFCGIRNVTWDSAHRTVTRADDGTPGYILTRAVEKYGRPISFVFAGNAAENDGADVHLDVARLQESYNFKAVTDGLAYPTYYTGLFHDLRDAMTAAVSAARKHALGLYTNDATANFVVNSLSDITDTNVILPKLFRRLSVYMMETGSAAGFLDALRLSREPVLDLRTSNFTHFDTFIKQNGSQIRMTRLPEELVFGEMPARPINHFSMLL